MRQGAEWGHVMPVFVQVKCEGHWGAVRNCGATTERAWRVRGWEVRRLNRLGATEAFLQEWGSCILGQQWHVRVGWRVSEGAGVGTPLCSLCWVEPQQMNRAQLSRHFSPGKSCVLMQLHLGRASTGRHLLQLLAACLFMCLCVSRAGWFVWRFFSLLTLLLTFSGLSLS